MRITRKTYADRIPSSRAVATLGQSEKAIQDDNCDGPAVHDARCAMVRRLTDYLRTHDDVTSIQVVASARYGGYTVEQYSRADLLG